MATLDIHSNGAQRIIYEVLCAIAFTLVIHDTVPAAVVKPIIRGGLIVKVITRGETFALTHPDPGASTKEVLPAFRPYFVFDASDDGSRVLKRDGFYRVSRTDAAKDIVGWVHEKDVMEWDHRECALFTPQRGRNLARIYRTLDDLKQNFKRAPGEDMVAISEEPAGLDNAARRHKMPLPILRTETWLDPDGECTAYMVAYLEARAPFDEPNTASKEDIAKQCGTVDVLFVIDATISMEPYIRAVRSVVESLAYELQRISDLVTFRLGLVAFRDHYPPNPGAMEFVVRRFVELTPNHAQFLEGLSQLREAPVSSINCRESLFDGLYDAIVNTDWSELALPVIIVIGDNSGREPDDPLNIYHRSLEQILDMAQERNIRFLCLKIVGRCDEDDDQNKHRRQMRRLADGMGAQTRGLYKEVAGENLRDYQDELLEFLRHEARLAEVRVESCIATMLGKELRRPDNLPEEDWTIILRTLPAGLAQRSQAAGLSFSTGWLLQRQTGGNRFVEPCVMLSGREYALYEWFLQNVKMVATAEILTIDDILATMGKTYERLTGEQMDLGPDEPIAEFLQRKHGLPVRDLTSLGWDIRRIETLSETQRQRIGEHVARKLLELQQFAQDQKNKLYLGQNFYVMFVPLSRLP